MKAIISETQFINRNKKAKVGQILKAPTGELFIITHIKTEGRRYISIESTLPGQKVDNTFRLP
jgi:hypothetical protein